MSLNTKILKLYPNKTKNKLTHVFTKIIIYQIMFYNTAASMNGLRLNLTV